MTLLERLRAAIDRPAPPGLLPGDLVDGEGVGEDHGYGGTVVPAAVLVAITRRAEPGVLLTVRREHLRTHAGQVAFPGGRVDPGDGNVTATALREAEEEIGLPRSAVTLWGIADPYRTVTGYRVVPVIGEVDADLPLLAQENEVADMFEAPLAFLLDPANQRRMSTEFRGARRHYYEIAWEDRRIWGATAAMLVNLTRRLQA